MGEESTPLTVMFVIITQRRRCPADSQILSTDTSTPTPGTRLSGEHGPLSRCHTHLLILAMVVSATRTKSSSGESCTPLGNRNWSSKTFTSLVSVSYSSRLWVPTAKGHTRRVHNSPAGLQPGSPLGKVLQEGTQPYTGVTRLPVAPAQTWSQAGP